MTMQAGVMRALFTLCLLIAASLSQAVPQLQLSLPLGRTCYQTNELVQLALLRVDTAALPSAELRLRLTGDDGSMITSTLPLPGAPLLNGDARATTHCYLRGDLLRQGKYQIEATANGATASANIEIFSHVRRSTFKLVDWASRAAGSEQAVLGTQSLGFNLDYTAYGGLAPDELIRGGLDYMQNCTMGGGFQLDLRKECDWSDPYVLGGATSRVVRRALMDRTNPNCIGVHYYDEPMLTVLPHPVTGKSVPYNIPAQDAAYRRIFGEDAPLYTTLDPERPADRARWETYMRWKIGFLEAASRVTRSQLESVQPDYLSTNQSVWAWWSFGTGNYFNEARSLAVLNGHGGYDPQPTRYFTPVYTQEFGRMREINKEFWFMPLWWMRTGNMVRLQHYLSFMHNVQGIMKPPDLTVHRPSTARFSEASPCPEGIVEANKTMERLGTIFTTMPPTRSQVAVLYALSQRIDTQMHNFEQYVFARDRHLMTLFQVSLASQLNQYPITPVVEEDVLDGTLSAQYKAVILAGLDYLDPAIIAALETYIVHGGTVLVSDDCTVKITGAVSIGLAVNIERAQRYYQLAGSRPEEAWDTSTAGGYMSDVQPFARALQAKLRDLGIAAVFNCDNPAIASARQVAGDIEYLFAINAAPAYDMTPRTPAVGQLGHADGLLLAAAEATITLADASRPVYDALLGEPAQEFRKAGTQLSAHLRFGPGQMRVFARSARPIGSVQLTTPQLSRDYTLEQDALRVDLTATLNDTQGQIISGTAPLQIRVIDPAGNVRYDLYRATRQGIFTLSLPLAANDRPGRWEVEVEELLAGKTAKSSFLLTTAADCPALVGTARRAVSFGNDEEHIFRFFRTYKQITIVKGTNEYNSSAAERLAAELKPWGIKCTIVDASDVNKPREISAEEAPTWCGPDYTSSSAIKPGSNNPINLVGYAVSGPVILLGTPADNPLINFLQQRRLLAYVPSADFPGRGRGMLAWQLDGIGLGQESIALIAYDATGMAEAVGSLNEAVAGLRPLTPRALATRVEILPPTAPAAALRKLAVVWQLKLPDRLAALKSLLNGDTLALGQDGTFLCLTPTGKTRWQKLIPGLEAWSLDSSLDGSIIALGAANSLYCFTAGGVLRWQQPISDNTVQRPVTFVSVAPDGRHIAAASEDGKLALFTAAGKRLWSREGDSAALSAKWEEKMAAWTTTRANYPQALKDWESAYARWQETPEQDRGAAPVRPQQMRRPNRPLPSLHLQGIFTEDSRHLIVLTTEQEQEIGDGTYPVRTAAYARSYTLDGTVGERITGIDPRVAPIRAGSEVLLAHSANKIIRCFPDGKTTDEAVLSNELFPPAVASPRTEPNYAVVALAWNKQRLIIALESAGTIVNFPIGAAEPAWTQRQPTLLTKRFEMRDGQSAVGYWGGLLQVLDTATGTPQASHQLTQDLTELTWSGPNLIVGQADGRVLALR